MKIRNRKKFEKKLRFWNQKYYFWNSWWFCRNMRGGPPTLYSSNQGYELLSLLSSSMSKSNKIPKTTTTPAPPQPVLWFPNNNADCGGSTKGSQEEFFLCPKVNSNSIVIFQDLNLLELLAFWLCFCPFSISSMWWLQMLITIIIGTISTTILEIWILQIILKAMRIGNQLYFMTLLYTSTMFEND